jgi:hypothetical protein
MTPEEWHAVHYEIRVQSSSIMLLRMLDAEDNKIENMIRQKTANKNYRRGIKSRVSSVAGQRCGDPRFSRCAMERVFIRYTT